VTVNYTAPNEKNRKATIHLEARSKRGITRTDVAVKTPGGYAIHDVWTLHSTGTAQVTADGDNYLIKLEIDFDIIWDTPDDLEDLLHQDHIKGHVSRELRVIPATEQECP
jgi:hypothetical protein